MKARKYRTAVRVLYGLIFFFSLVIGIMLARKTDFAGLLESLGSKGGRYESGITSSDFVLGVNNPFFTLTPGRKFVYEKKDHDGTERVEVTVTGETRIVNGIVARVVLDRVYFNGGLIEETYDWYAQDRTGNVWYLGEEVGNFRNGVLVNHDGAWEAGVDGAEPGIIMPAKPAAGFEYRQEYLAGVAEDMGRIVSTGNRVKTAFGEFDDCVKTRDWSLLESGAEFKYYCPGIGFMAMEEDISGKDRLELISVSE